MKIILSILVSLLLLKSSFGQTWVSQSGSGNDSGSDSGNTMPIATYNSSGSGSVNLVGTLTTELTATSGTIYFEPNAKFSATTWSGNIITAANNVTIDGGQNGIIEATANGTGLAYSNDFSGVLINNASGVTVKNLTIQNLYVHIPGGDDTAAGNGLFVEGNFPNLTVSNCVIHDSLHGIMMAYSFGTNLVFTHNQIYNVNWGIAGGDYPGGFLSGVMIDHNHIYGFSTWDVPDNINHHDGIYIWAQQTGGSFSNIVYNANHLGPGYGSYANAGIFDTGVGYSLFAYNNFFDGSDGSHAASGELAFGCAYESVATTFAIFNNTFVGGYVNMDVGSVAWSPTTVICTNNEFYNNPVPINNVTQTNISLLSDYNNFYNVSVGFEMGLNGSGNFEPFAIWQEWTGDVDDMHSTTSDPMLDGSYVPQTGSPLIGAGMNLTSLNLPGLNVDYAGNPRPASGAWDIGAYEYSVGGLIQPQPSGKGGLPPGRVLLLEARTNTATMVVKGKYE